MNHQLEKSLKKSLKMVVVGDGACGKTSLIVAHSGGGFTDEYTPTAFDDYAIEALVNRKTKVMTVCDTAGEQDFDSLRPLSYPDADVIIVCYSIDRQDSIKHIREKWVPEIKRFCPNTPVLVVGNKKDIRDEPARSSDSSSFDESELDNFVSLSEAEALAKEVSFYPVIECSAKTRENVKLVFDTAVQAALAHRTRCHSKVIQSIMKLKLVF